MELTPIEKAMDAGRVCEAISRIGYTPWSAVMDIVDNSVEADATSVTIEIQWNIETPNVYFQSKSNVLSYRISDNGFGMTEDEIQTALQLGSDVVYPENSLSKFGMGLKSAGFSLGERITVFSKKDGKWSYKNYLDQSIMKDSKKWLINREEVSKADMIELD